MSKFIFGLFIVSLLLTPTGSPQALVHFDFEQPYFIDPGVIVKDHSLLKVDGVFHLFYLRGNPAVNLGHAISTDLIHWELKPPVLQVVPGTWDGSAVWAPQVIQYAGGSFLMYYTGVNSVVSQQTGLAFTSDLYNWVKLMWPIYHPDPAWAAWSEDSWSHGRDPFVFEHDGTIYQLLTVKTNDNKGAIASAISNNYVTWTDNGPIYVHDSWHVLESVQCIVKDGIFHLFFTEEEVSGTSHMMSTELYSGWDISTRTILDLGQAPEIDFFDGSYLFSRHTGYYDEQGQVSYLLRFDPLTWVGTTPALNKPWALSPDWNLVFGIAFAYQPTFSNNPYFRGDDTPLDYEGYCWIGSYERYQGPLMYGSPGGAQGDGATGMIRSDPFVITGNSMNLLVGGGNYPDHCYVSLVESGSSVVLFKETGNNTDTMTRRYWDLTPHRGKTVFIEIADLSSSSFGHINVDDIVESVDVLNPNTGDGDLGKSKVRPDTIELSGDTPDSPALYQNSPNPFNPATLITYYLPAAGMATLDIYDVNGALIKILVNNRKTGGQHCIEWDGTNDAGRPVAAGIYFYRLIASGSIIDTKKMVLLK
jgi:hypothetical protein